MPEMPVLATEIVANDKINIGGGWYTVTNAVLWGGRICIDANPQITLYLPRTATVTVDRPDPDEAVLAAMAKAICDDSGLDFALHRKVSVRAARASLAAYREHTEKTMAAALKEGH